jgi:hypothetical protein
MCRPLLAVGALALLGLASPAVFFVASEPTSRLTREGFERVRVGMGRSEVTALLGPPTGEAPNLWCWEEDDRVVLVFPDEAGRVTIKDWCDLPREGFLDRLRRLLPW